MDAEILRPIFTGLLAGFATPIVMSLWGKLSPPAKSSPHDSFSEQELIRRNNWINNISIVLLFVGIGVSLLLYENGASPHDPWPAGLGFGLMVILPVTFISLVTLPRGIRRYGEFWRFYELKYKVSLKSIFILYLLLGLLGVVSAYKIVF